MTIFERDDHSPTITVWPVSSIDVRQQQLISEYELLVATGSATETVRAVPLYEQSW